MNAPADTSEPAAVPVPLGNTPAAPGLPVGKRADEFADYPRDQWDRPLIAVLGPDGRPTPNPLTGQTDRFGTPIPWVSTAYQRASGAGGALEYEGNLNSWHLRQAVIGLVARPDLFALVQAVEDPGGAGRDEIDAKITKAQEAAGSSTAANLGTAGHAFSEKIDRGQTLPPLDEPFAGWVRAYREVTKGWTWHAIEERLVCDDVELAGRCDRLGSPPEFMIAPDGQIIGPGDVLAVDLKTSSSSRYFGVKFAVQLAVYACGDRYDQRTGLRTPTGARRDWALVVHIPTGGSSGQLYWVNVAVGLELAHLAKRVLRERGRKDLVLAVPAGRSFPTLDSALAAGGVVQVQPPISDPVADVFAPDGPCGCGQDHPRTTECPDPYLPSAASTAEYVAANTVPAVTGDRSADVAIAEGAQPHPTAGQDPSNPLNIPPDLATKLQAQGDPARRLELELHVVATAPPRGAMGAIRERYAARWTEQLEQAAQLREWELGVIMSLERARSVDDLYATAAECQGYGRWTAEMLRVATRRVGELERES